MTICKWPTKPLSQVQVTVGETSMMATPERAYFDAVAVNEAVMAERERMCVAIKAADDIASKADYMLDSDDCISVIRGTWALKA